MHSPLPDAPHAPARAEAGPRFATAPQRVDADRIAFRAVGPADYPFLYAILLERYRSGTVNIEGMAADELPSYRDHVAFLERRPRTNNHIIVADGVDVGSIFVDMDGIASCFVLGAYMGRGIGVAACSKLFQECALPVRAYMNPRNLPSVRMARRLGMTLIEDLPHRMGFELRRRPDAVRDDATEAPPVT